MAFETNKEAAEWKAAIEAQIRYVAETRRPMLPDSVDAKTISAILDLGQSGCVWKRVAVYEGVCVLEHITFEKRSQGRYKYHPLMNMQVCLSSFFSVILAAPALHLVISCAQQYNRPGIICAYCIAPSI